MRRSFFVLAFALLVCLSPLGHAQTTPPVGVTLLASDGNLYGVDPAQGFFRASLTATKTTVLNPSQTALTLCLERSDGTLLGLGAVNGYYPWLVKISLTGAITPIAKFAGASDDPACPAMANDGNYYGAATGGGTGNNGYLYQLTSAGELNVFHNFAADGGAYAVQGTPVQGSDGNLYYQGNAALLKYNTSSGLTSYPVPFLFALPALATVPSLVEGPDSNFYALAAESPAETVEKLTPSGTATTLFTGQVDGNDDYPVLQGVWALGENSLAVMQQYSLNFGSDNPCSTDIVNQYYVAVPVSLTGSIGNPIYENGSIDELGPDESSFQDVQATTLLGGAGFYGESSSQEWDISENTSCETFNSPAAGYAYPLASGSQPITMTLSKTHVLPGAKDTLIWSVNNAFSDTMKQCYGYGGLSGKVALTGNVTGATPSTPGNYVVSIVCGGTETSFVTISTGPVNVALSVVSQYPQIGIGEPVEMVAYISSYGTPGPTGNMEFLTGPTVIGAAPLVYNETYHYYTATYTASTAGLKPGTYPVTAKYVGDSNYVASPSETVSLTLVNRTPTTLVLSPASQTVTVGSSTVVLSAAATGEGLYDAPDGEPTGIVTLMAGSTVVDTGALGGQDGNTTTANLSTTDSGLVAGTYYLQATYPGNNYNLPATSNVVKVIVTGAQ